MYVDFGRSTWIGKSTCGCTTTWPSILGVSGFSEILRNHPIIIGGLIKHLIISVGLTIMWHKSDIYNQMLS